MKNLTEGNVSKVILSFALPMLLGNVVQQSYTIIDRAVVGHYIGKEAVAAVGAASPIIFFLISLVVGIANGANIIISQYFGAKEMKKVTMAIDTLNVFLLISSLLVSALGIYFSRDIFELMNTPADVIEGAITYMRIYLFGLAGLFGFHGLSAIMRGLGDSKTPVYFLLISSLLNIFLDLSLIIYFDMGVAGVAWATILAQGLTFVAMIFYVNKRHKVIKIRVIGLELSKEIFRNSVRLGLPNGLQQSFVALGMMTLFGIVNQFGTQTAAAYSIAGSVDMFAAIPAMVFSQALSTFVGQNVGAKKLERVKQGFWTTLVIALVICLIMTFVIINWGENIMSIFIDDPEIISIGTKYLVIVSSFYACFAILFVSNGALRGAGDTLIPMFITFIALWAIRIPLSYFLSKEYGAIGIWWGIPAGWIIGMSFAFTYFLKGNWKNKAVV